MSADIFLGDSQFDWSKCLCITNRHLCPGTLEDQLERHVLPLRPRAVILREKDLTPAEYSDLLRRVAAIDPLLRVRFATFVARPTCL